MEGYLLLFASSFLVGDECDYHEWVDVSGDSWKLKLRCHDDMPGGRAFIIR